MTRDLFWFVAGVMAAVAGLLVAIPLLRSWRGEANSPSRRGLWLGAAIVAGIAAATVGLYTWIGTPSAVGTAQEHAASAAQAPHAGAAGSGAAGQALSMDEATSRLAARLAAEGGTQADWQLLAQSYDFLGRGPEAAAARERAKSAPASGRSAAAAVAAPAMAPAPTPSAADQAELDKAADLRRQHDLKGANAIYARLAARGALTADGWADYADATASQHDGKLSGEPARYIDEALRQDPRHIKALWLKASLAYQEKRYADAVPVWSALRNALPPDSPDQGTVTANLEESARLAGLPVAASSSVTANGARIEGTVELASEVRDRAGAGATLFIYAKQIGAGGPPLAVLRVTAERWPVSFVLDDSNSMMPGRDLSHADKVQLEARISRSGNAIPQSGDLVGTIAAVDPRAGKPVRISINHVF